MPTPRALDKRDALLGALIFAGALATLLATMEIGFTRDESFYFHAARAITSSGLRRSTKT